MRAIDVAFRVKLLIKSQTGGGVRCLVRGKIGDFCFFFQLDLGVHEGIGLEGGEGGGCLRARPPTFACSTSKQDKWHPQATRAPLCQRVAKARHDGRSWQSNVHQARFLCDECGHCGKEGLACARQSVEDVDVMCRLDNHTD